MQAFTVIFGNCNCYPHLRLRATVFPQLKLSLASTSADTKRQPHPFGYKRHCASDFTVHNISYLLPCFARYLLIVQFSRYVGFLIPNLKLHLSIGFEIRQQKLSFGGPEWARTTDLTIISRTL